MSERTSINLPARLSDRLRAVAQKLGQTTNSVATSMIEGCLDACDAPLPKTPPIVRLYRQFERKDIDLVDKLSLAILRTMFPKWEKEGDLWKEMLGRLIDVHVTEGKPLDQASISALGREARKLAKALGQTSAAEDSAAE